MGDHNMSDTHSEKLRDLLDMEKYEMSNALGGLTNLRANNFESIFV